MFSDPHKTDKYIVWAERTICVTPSCTYSYRWVLKGVGFVGALSFCTPFRVAFIYDEDLHINTILAPFIAVFYMCCRPHVHSPLHTVQQHPAYYSSASTKIAKLIWCNCEWKWIRGLQNKVAIMNAQKSVPTCGTRMTNECQQGEATSNCNSEVTSHCGWYGWNVTGHLTGAPQFNLNYVNRFKY